MERIATQIIKPRMRERERGADLNFFSLDWYSWRTWLSDIDFILNYYKVELHFVLLEGYYYKGMLSS